MDANDPAARRAFMLLPLFLKEVVYPAPLYLIKVLNHAHPVIPAVPLIDTLQVTAGKVRAFKTKRDKVACYLFTLTFKEGALLVTGTAPGAVSNFTSLPGEVPGIGKVSAADAAVHAARGD